MTSSPEFWSSQAALLSTVTWQAVIGLLTVAVDETPKKEPDSTHLSVSWMS